MPISSGGEGHVGLGVDTSIKWVPDGWKDEHSLRNSNSYLQRHLKRHVGNGKIKPEEQPNTYTQRKGMPKSEDNKHVSKMDTKHKEHKTKTQQGHDGYDSHINSKQNITNPPAASSRKKPAKSEASTKKSSTCILL